MAKRRSKEEIARDRLVEDACNRLCAGYQIGIFDLEFIRDAGKTAAETGGDVDAAVLAAVKQYGKPV